MSKLKRAILFIILVALITGCHSSSSGKKNTDDSLQFYPPTPAVLEKNEFRNYYRQLNEFFDTALLKNGFNGAILIAKNGAVIYEKYSGRTDLRKKDSITPETAFHIASTSKPFTAVALLQMVQQGKLSLNDSLEKFFPGFPYYGITVKMLLTHRSGLPNYLYFMSHNKWGMDEKAMPGSRKGQWNRQYASNKDVLKMLMDKKPDPTGQPGRKFTYSNTNYVLLAMIVEKLSGMTFPDYMEQKFFRPLGMDHSYVFRLKDTLTASPSFTNNGTYWNFDFLDATYGDKNIYSTVRDLLKWDQALYTDKVLNKSMLDSSFLGYSFEEPGIHNYGLGWRLQLLPNGKKVVYHFGKWHGNNAAFARLIDEKATIIILGNRFTRSIYHSAHLCYDIFGDYQQRRINEEEESNKTHTANKTTPLVIGSKKSGK